MNVPAIVPVEFQAGDGKVFESDGFNHPLTGSSRRYVCGDRFHSTNNPHKSPLCEYHNINLCKQASTIKTSYQESMNHKKNQKRNRSSCTQSILTHIYYNYLMNYYDNEEVVKKQKENLESQKRTIVKDQFLRMVLQ